MAYEIIKADLEADNEHIVRFWSVNFPGWDKNKYTWFYCSNIYGPADCWMIVDSNNKTVVGTSSIFPRQFYSNGKTLYAGIAGDFAVDKNHRVLGPALQLQKKILSFCQANKYDFIYGYPNMRAEPVLKRAGYTVLGPTVRMARILKSETYINKHIHHHTFAWLLGLIVDKAISLFARESRIRIDKSFRYESLNCIDERFDDLWERAKDNYPLIGDRTSAFLKWRFDDSPRKKYKIIVILKNDQLVGYIIYHVHDETVFIADVLAETLQILDQCLIPTFLKHISKSNFASVSVLFAGLEDVITIFKKYHFSIRSKERNLIVASHAVADGLMPAQDIGQWYFFEADND